MCLACVELSKDNLPTSKVLARAYTEMYNTSPPEHDGEILQKLLKRLEDSDLTHEEQMQYVLDANTEMEAIIDLLGRPTAGSLS